MPLSDTIVDFWHLVYDQESPIIIMLDEAQSQVHLNGVSTGCFYRVLLQGASTHILVRVTMEYFSLTHNVCSQFNCKIFSSH